MEQVSYLPSTPVRVITYNIRYARKEPVPGELPWVTRSPLVCAQLRFLAAGHTSAFICLQECLHHQVTDVEASLGPAWKRLGQGRADGKNGGEFSPIFYPTAAWECVRAKTYWLSPTPEVPSRGWDAALNRVVTTAEFRHRQNPGLGIVVMSTHFDHVGVVARAESAKLLLRIAQEWSTGHDGSSNLPVLIGGDFNSPPEDQGYQIMTAPGSGMVDIVGLIPPERRFGNEITYTTFGESTERPKRIDFLFLHQPEARQKTDIETFAVLTNRFDDGVFISDHRPVVADLAIPAEPDGPASLS